MTLFRYNLPNINSKIRLIHAIPTAPNVDVYAGGKLISKNLSFSNITPYMDLSPGTYDIEIYITGTYDNPIFNKTIDLAPSTSFTISVVTIDNAIKLFLLSDSNIANDLNKTFLRFINLSPNSSLITLSLLNNKILFNSVGSLETTNYVSLSSGVYDFLINFSNFDGLEKHISSLKLNAGKVYTIYIIGLLNGFPALGYLVTDDSKV